MNDLKLLATDGTDLVRLDNGKRVSLAEYQAVLETVTTFVRTMVPGHSYSAETMVGQMIWRSKLKWRAGPIVAHAVRRGLLPLRFADNGKRSTYSYELDT